MIHNFSWLLPGRLAGFGLVHAPDLQDLSALRGEGVDAIVSLTEVPLDRTALAAAGLQYLHLPVADMEPPSQAQLHTFVGFVDRQLAAGGAVAVHCRAGLGRTGTMLTAYLIHQGVAPGQALMQVRSQRPGSVETRAQEEVLWSFGRGREVEAR